MAGWHYWRCLTGKSELAEFMNDAGSRPYRKLVEHNLQRLSEDRMRMAVLSALANSWRQSSGRLAELKITGYLTGRFCASWRMSPLSLRLGIAG